jgi:hypothetical protein
MARLRVGERDVREALAGLRADADKLTRNLLGGAG